MIPVFIAPMITSKKAVALVYSSVFGLAIALAFTIEGATALAIATTALITAIFIGVVNVITVVQSKADRKAARDETAEQAKKLAELHTTTTKIENATNGTLHTLTSTNQVLLARIDGLETLVASMAATKAQALAVTEAGKLTPPSVPQTPPTQVVVEKIVEILPRVAEVLPRVAELLPVVHEEIKAVAKLSADTNETAHRIEDTVKPT